MSQESGGSTSTEKRADLRVDKAWHIERNAQGRVVLYLDTDYRYGSEPDGGRYARTIVVLPEPMGMDVWLSINQQQGEVIEKALAEGARVPELAAPGPAPEAGTSGVP